MKVERYRLSEWAQRVLNDGHAGTIAIASLCHAAEDALRVHAGPLPRSSPALLHTRSFHHRCGSYAANHPGSRTAASKNLYYLHRAFKAA
jgi:hypothetical protein